MGISNASSLSGGEQGRASGWSTLSLGAAQIQFANAVQQPRVWLVRRAKTTTSQFAAIFVSFVVITTSNLVFHTPGGIADVHSIAGCLLCVMLSSGIMGIIALFGISRYGWKRILWRAAVGVITSVIVGFLAWLFLALEHFKQ